MQFFYHKYAGQELIELDGEGFSHIIKARRAKDGEKIFLRNLKDHYLYTYSIHQVNKKTAQLALHSSLKDEGIARSGLHLLWAVIDPKVIEKTLPMLNELGVSKISFFYATHSQRHFKLHFERMEKILIASSQQCGRADIITLELIDDMKEYTPIIAFDFAQNLPHTHIHCNPLPLRIAIGCEGGFSQQERLQFSKVFTLEGGSILRSESAAVFLASLAAQQAQTI